MRVGKQVVGWLLAVMIFGLAGCNLDLEESNNSGGAGGDLYLVVNVVDGDTIDVERNGQTFRVRYVGVNTPERGEGCYTEATAANRTLVLGQQVRMERDVNDTDRFDRLLRYIYVGDVFVNESLVRDGWAEVVNYPPDERYFDRFRVLEIEATNAGRGCHPTGIFADNTYTR